MVTKKVTKNMAKAIPWTDRFEPPVSASQHPPTNMVTSSECAHSKEELFSGRVKEAHSLADLERQTADGNSLTLAMTWGVETSRHEVGAWLAEKSMMAVQQVEEQCLACAVRLGRCVGALVVVC